MSCRSLRRPWLPAFRYLLSARNCLNLAPHFNRVLGNVVPQERCPRVRRAAVSCQAKKSFLWEAWRLCEGGMQRPHACGVRACACRPCGAYTPSGSSPKRLIMPCETGKSMRLLRVYPSGRPASSLRACNWKASCSRRWSAVPRPALKACRRSPVAGDQAAVSGACCLYVAAVQRGRQCWAALPLVFLSRLPSGNGGLQINRCGSMWSARPARPWCEEA